MAEREGREWIYAATNCESDDYRRFLIIARASARKTQGRYRRMRHWIPPKVVRERVALAEEISRILTATINRLCNK